MKNELFGCRQMLAINSKIGSDAKTSKNQSKNNVNDF